MVTKLAAVLAASVSLLVALPLLARAYYRPESRASNIPVGLIFLFVSVVFFTLRNRL